MIGIYGMGGIGKTTIARAVYESMSCEFEGSSFLANVREISLKSGLVSLQKQLLSQILQETDINIWDADEGIAMIRSRLRNKKVLIVIDDVDDVMQLNKLAGRHDWFGLGSKIIITTRDKHLLMTNRVDKLYKAEELDDDEAFQLFSLKAFKNYQPSKEYMELSKCVIKYASGLPLALQIFGSFLFGRSVNEWESALQRIGKDSEKGILDSLEISFDGLEETEKKIFLDVACFFKGMTRDYVARILEACGFYPDIGIRVLIDKSLLTISDDNKLCMHDLVQEMGQQIVKRDCPHEPGKRSRLWEEEDVIHMLTRNTATEAVEGIILGEKMQLSGNAKAFSKMTNLRLLKINNEQLSRGLEYLSNELRLLEWHGYALKALPSSLKLDNTVELRMPHSKIEQLWKETQPLTKLKVINLSHSKHLTKTPDFTEVPNLEELILEGCTSLSEIHSSLLVHKKLIMLSLKDCTNLMALPREFNMVSLRKFILSGCLKLKKFPEIVRSMESLSELFLDETSIKKLPFPVEVLEGLVLLSLEDCKNLMSIPSNINILKSLRTLNLSGCSKLENVPENLGEVECLEKLDVSGTAIRQPVSSIFFMKNLKLLSFRGCKGTPSNSWYLGFPFRLMSRSSGPITLMLPSLSGLCSLTVLSLGDCNLEEGAIPNEFGSLVTLQQLDLSYNSFVSLPSSINRLSNLMDLELLDCKRLQSLPELPSSLESVDVNNCTSLEIFSEALKSCEPSRISAVNCPKLLDYNNVAFPILEEMPDPRTEEIIQIVVPGSGIPKWFSHQNEGYSIKVKHPPGLMVKGYAVCAIIFARKLRSKVHECRFFKFECNSNFFSISDGICEDNAGQGLADHVWLQYLPRTYSPELVGSDKFKFLSTGDSVLEVKRCAVHPVYRQEVDKLDRLTDALEMDVTTTERNLSDSDGTETSGSDNSDYAETGSSDADNSDGDEPQPKRQKKIESS